MPGSESTFSLSDSFGMNTCGRNGEMACSLSFGFDKFSINLDPKGKENNLVMAKTDSKLIQNVFFF